MLTEGSILRSVFVGPSDVFAALPPDVRKGSAFPRVALRLLGLRPNLFPNGAQPRMNQNNCFGRSETSRTSSGGAARNLTEASFGWLRVIRALRVRLSGRLKIAQRFNRWVSDTVSEQVREADD